LLHLVGYLYNWQMGFNSVFKGLNFTLKQLRPVSVLQLHTIIRERINSCLLKLQLLKYSTKVHRCVVNTVVVWLQILGPYWCMYGALFGSRLS